MEYIKYFIVLILTALMLPNFLNAASKVKVENYNTMNLKQTLKAEEMEELFTKYEEKDDQITIYLFRGQGCGFCRSFLTFLNGITEEYGKYFKLVSFEVWNDQTNNDLMMELSTFLGQRAEGVPYIIIGNTAFPGYNEIYDDAIKEAILSEYQKSANDRYDLFGEYNKSLKSQITLSNTAMIIIISAINLVIAAAAVVVVIAHQNKLFAHACGCNCGCTDECECGCKDEEKKETKKTKKRK